MGSRACQSRLLVSEGARECSHPQLVNPDCWSQKMKLSLAFMSQLSSMSFVYLSKCHLWDSGPVGCNHVEMIGLEAGIAT